MHRVVSKMTFFDGLHCHFPAFLLLSAVMLGNLDPSLVETIGKNSRDVVITTMIV